METKQAKYQALFEERVGDASFLTIKDMASLFRLVSELCVFVASTLKELAHSQLDTQEERDAIREAVLAVYEKLAKRIIGDSVWGASISGLGRTALKEYMDSLLLKAEQATA